MSKGPNNKRSRPRGRPRRGGPQGRGGRSFESAGPKEKVRGTPEQIIDKYNALAREAQADSDRVMAESYLQHAEHYFRLSREEKSGQDGAQKAQGKGNGAKKPKSKSADPGGTPQPDAPAADAAAPEKSGARKKKKVNGNAADPGGDDKPRKTKPAKEKSEPADKPDDNGDSERAA